MTTPADPLGLGLEPEPAYTTYSYIDPLGVDYTVVTVSWVPATTYDDGSPADVLQYVVEVSYDGGATYTGSVVVSGDVTMAQLPPFVSGTSIWWRVQGIPVSGIPSEPSAPVFVDIPADTTPPPIPVAPTLTSKLGVITVSWNGTFVAGGLRPDDFARIDVYMSTNGGLDYSPIGQLPAAGSMAVGGQGIGSTRHFKFQATDVRGNASDSSAAASILVVGVQGPDIEANAVTANSIKAGSLDAFIVTGGTIRSAASGARVQMDGFGITQYDSANTALSNWSSTGFNFKTALSGARLELNSGGLNLYNSAGQNVVALTSTGTATVTGKFTTGQATAYPRIEVDSVETGQQGFGMRLYSTSGSYYPGGVWTNTPGSSVRGRIVLAAERLTSTSRWTYADLSPTGGVGLNAFGDSSFTVNPSAHAYMTVAAANSDTINSASAVSMTAQAMGFNSSTPNAGTAGGTGASWCPTALTIGGPINRANRNAIVRAEAADYIWMRAGSSTLSDTLLLNQYGASDVPSAQLISAAGQVHLGAGVGVQGIGSDNSVYLTAADKVVVRTNNGTTSTDRLQIDAASGVQNKNGARLARWGNDGTTSWMTDNSASIDAWLSTTFSGTLSGGAYTAKLDYYISYDRIAHITCYVTFSTAPTATANMAFGAVVPAAARPMASPNGLAPRGTGSGPGSAAIGCTVSSAGALNVFNVPAAAGILAFSINYPVAKPS